MAAVAMDSIYTTDNITVPTEVQYNFSNQYNMEDPEQARINYMRIMHEHTKQQFQMATASSRRRNSPAAHDVASLQPTTSSTGSVSSVSDSSQPTFHVNDSGRSHIPRGHANIRDISICNFREHVLYTRQHAANAAFAATSSLHCKSPEFPSSS
ncbi:hypothetical protein K461DRAFT_293634 [Myriangium duriaei CBS 260.36]|uniref:Uncharacterized protein n=1 Tax=Myriangium duriaei CBS 260.36 TaxID=1168546 RepID=A0A9P4J0R8_9PEZI|nr:hypothetical protein K461DRAFT_293634 [Myriangium duriaei CBS 260.36]